MWRFMIFSDLHCPFHDPRAVKLLIRVAADIKPDLLIAAGDLCDAYSLSKFAKDPKRKTNIVDEIKTMHGVLSILDAPHKKYILGNHEDRLRKYGWQTAPAVWGFLRDHHDFGMKNLGWDMIPYNQSFKTGDLVVAHDFGRIGDGAAKHAAILHPDKKVVIGHTHKISNYKEAHTLGWLGDVDKIDYMHLDVIKDEWRHGFMVGTLDKQNRAHLKPVGINNYVCHVAGKIYEG